MERLSRKLQKWRGSGGVVRMSGERPSVKERRRVFEEFMAASEGSNRGNRPEDLPQPRRAVTTSSPQLRRSGLVVVRPKLPKTSPSHAQRPSPPALPTIPKMSKLQPQQAVDETGAEDKKHYEHIYAVYDVGQSSRQEKDAPQPSTSHHAPGPTPPTRLEVLKDVQSQKKRVRQPASHRVAVSEDNIPGLFRREEPVQEQHSVGNSSFFSAADADELHYAASSIQDRMSFYEGLKPRSASDSAQKRPGAANLDVDLPSRTDSITQPPTRTAGGLTACVAAHMNGSDGEADEEDSASSADSPEISKRAERARRIKRQTTVMYEHQEMAFRKRRGGGRLFQIAAAVQLTSLQQLSPADREQLQAQGLLSHSALTDRPAPQFLPRLSWTLPSSSAACSPDTLAMLPFLAYPDFSHAASASSSTLAEEPFIVTMTDADARRSFVYCLRHAAPGQPFPLVLCIVSPLRAASVYLPLLREAVACPAPIRRDFLAAAYRHQVPHYGGLLRLDLPGKRLGHKILLEHSRFGALGLDGVAALLRRLGAENVLAVFTALLCEKRVLIAGESVSAVARTVGAFAALLQPLEWPHTLFPIVSDTSVSFCYCPTPYLIGILRVNLNQLKDLLTGAAEDEEEFLLIVDLDYGIIRDSDYSQSREERLRASRIDPSRPVPESRALPERVRSRLRHGLREALGGRGQMGSTESTEDSGSPGRSVDPLSGARAARTARAADEAVRSAFAESLWTLLGHARAHFGRQQQDGRQVFHKAAFLAAPTSKSHRAFLHWFSDSSMFQIWLREAETAVAAGKDPSELLWPVGGPERSGKGAVSSDLLGGLVRSVSSLLSW